jgi:hypothetical protein
MRPIATGSIAAAALLTTACVVENNAPPPRPAYYYGSPPGAGYATPSSPPQGAAPMAPPARPPGPAPLPAPQAGEAPSFGVPTGPGWTLREKEQWANLAGAVKPHMDNMNRACGTNMGGGFVFDTFRGHFIPQYEFGAPGLDDHVVAPMQALEGLCEKGPMQRNAVRQKLQRIEIRWQAVGKSTWAVALPTLACAVNPQGEYGGDYWVAIENGVPNYL